jgi:uncharacterized protein with PQ loop repeat
VGLLRISRDFVILAEPEASSRMVVAATGLFATTIAPCLGAILSNLMWGVPVVDILGARKAGTLGAINPAPYIVGLYNTFGWTLYGSLTTDGYLMWANFAAISVLLFSVMSIVALLNIDIVKETVGLSVSAAPGSGGSAGATSSQVEDKIKSLESKRTLLFYTETGMCVAPVLWGLLSWLSWCVWSNDKAVKIVGWFALVQNVLYFFAPLTALGEVIKKKDASPIFPPAVVATTVNSSMWFIYGYFSVQDPNIWVPNIMGIVLQVVNAVLLLMYPRSAAAAAATALALKKDPTAYSKV